MVSETFFKVDRVRTIAGIVRIQDNSQAGFIYSQEKSLDVRERSAIAECPQVERLKCEEKFARLYLHLAHDGSSTKY